ncbi:ABC transporter ATP-binding protein/permease [Candidatus Thioglobus sp.]|nr:ABC transporter ATP-binding protein/permease [Candidatus Thioglobus sp.]
MKKDFLSVWLILTRKEHKQLLIVALLQIIAGLSDMLGVVSIFPFLSLLANPELLQTNEIYAQVQAWVQLPYESFIIMLGLISLISLAINQIFRLTAGWYGAYISHNIWRSLHNRTFSYYLQRPYVYHLHNPSNELLEKLQVRLNAAVAGVVTPFFLLISSSFSLLFVMAALIYASPIMTLTLLSIVGLFYFILYTKIKVKLDHYGKISPEYSSKVFGLITEAFGAIKEIKVRHNERNYLKLFNPLAKRYCDSQVKIYLFSEIPAGLVELVAFGGILLISLIMLSTSGSIQEIIPLLGMYVLALRRLLPAINALYMQISNIRFYKPSFDVVKKDLFEATLMSQDENKLSKRSRNNLVNKEIKLENVSFTYPESVNKVIDKVSLTIPSGSLVGIAGGSGAGKTTLVDLILGLLDSNSGNILIEGEKLTKKNIFNWQSNIGYVPQNGFIADGTISRNIAFGNLDSEIDRQRVEMVAKIAQISDFIEKELPQQYDTLVGERGVRLSGGQRQRLSIARAIYHDPEVLIMDEATSALDGITEEKVMRSILEFSKEKTIILIAHRLTTLQECDTIFLFDNGQIVDQGDYETLTKTNSMFYRMTRNVEK